MHNGQENKGNAEQKNDQPLANVLVTNTAATTSISLIPSGSVLSSTVGFLRSAREIKAQITTCHQTGSELVALGQDLSRLLTTETPNIVRLPEILTRHLSALFPIAQGEDIISKMQSAMFQLMTFGVNPALALSGAQQVMGAGVAKIDQGQHVLASAVHSAGGPASNVLDIYNIYAGISSLYTTYTELNRLYNSILFCSERMHTSAQELMELTGGKDQWEEIKTALADYWNQPGFDFNAFLNQAKEQFQTILTPLENMIALYELMEPMRIASYLALTTQTEQDAKSQLDQVTELLTNACCNTVLDNISAASKSTGNTLGRALPAAGLKTLKNVGTKAALTACATAVTGMSFPITIAILATCTDKKNRDALIAYAKSRIVGSEGSETKSDENVRAIVSNELHDLENEDSSLFSRLKTRISGKISATINAAMAGCIDASGNVVGAAAEQAMRTLMQDSNFVSTLRDQLDPVIYQILDQTLRQTLQIPEQKAFLDRIESMSAGEATAYQVSGALIPDMVNWLALPNLVEQQLQAATGNPYICSATGKPLTLKEKVIQGTTRMASTVVKANVAAASEMIKAGQAAREAIIRGTTSPLPTPAALGNTTESQLLALGSTANRESKKGLRVYLVEVPHDTTIEDAQRNMSMPAPAIVFSTKSTTSLMGLRNKQLIEIKGFNLAKKRDGITAIASFVTDVTDVTDKTRIVSMKTLEKENKSRSESTWLADLQNQSMAFVQETTRTGSTRSVLLPWDHPLVKSLTTQLNHKQPKEFNYVKQHAMQQQILETQKQRVINREASEKQAAELQKTEETAKKAGFTQEFFEDFETPLVIQERYEQLLKVLETVDTLPINNVAPEDIDPVRQYIKTRLVNRSQELLIHINSAKERLQRNFKRLDIEPIKGRLATIKKAIEDVDNLGWFASAVTPEARTHYLALLDLHKDETEATITALSKPLKDLEEGNYDLVTDYLKENPEKAALLSTEVSHHKKAFWIWQSWPEDLIKLDQYLLEILSKNKPLENVPNLRIHLPQEPAPTLMFAQESKEVRDYKTEEELQLAKALILSGAEAIAASEGKIGPKTINGWELTDVSEIGNCFYEAIALQLQKNNFPIAETFPETKPENGGTALTDILRRRSTPEFRDRDWAGEEEILAFAKKFKVVIAIVDTRSEEPAFQYHLVLKLFKHVPYLDSLEMSPIS